MSGILEALLVQILIPEIAGILRKTPDATDEEIIAEFLARRQGIIDRGRAFLAANPTPPTP